VLAGKRAWLGHMLRDRDNQSIELVNRRKNVRKKEALWVETGQA